jgi:uncharacterized C2H2 Zn-finger protein
MGSVIDYIECPRCKEENCLDDFYYKTGEEYINCPDCGYHRVFHYKRDENGNFLKKDEAKGYEFENLISEEVHIENPYGAYRVESILGGATCGTLATDDDYQKFVSEIVSLINQKHDIKEVVVSRLVGEKIEKEIVFKNDKHE